MKLRNFTHSWFAIALLPFVTLAGCATLPQQSSSSRATAPVYRDSSLPGQSPVQRSTGGDYGAGAVSQQPAPTYQRPVETNNAAAALLRDAKVALSKNDFTHAVSSAERAQRVAPRDPDVYLTLSRIRCAQGNYGQCEQLARKAISLQPSLPQRDEAQRLIARARTAE